MWPKWLRAVTGAWVYLDSQKRGAFSLFWVPLIVVLGPLLIPLYLTCRPLLEKETRRGGFFWNLFWNFEPLVSGLTGIASVAVMIENLMESNRTDLAEVKKAEIKAGSILGIIVVFVLFGFSRIFFGLVKNSLEE